MKNKGKIKCFLLLSFCTLGYLLLQIGILICDSNGHFAFNGVMLSFQFIMCLFMIRISVKAGWPLSISLIGFSILLSISGILKSHSLRPLPGVCNLLVFGTILGLLNAQFKIRSKESVTDMVTGLNNRRGLYKIIKQKIENQTPFFVICIYLDNFKIISENYNHSLGNSLMKIATERISNIIQNMAQAARVEDDEFYVVLNAKYDAKEVSNEILRSLSEKIICHVDGNSTETYLTACIGISVYPSDSVVAEDLIKYADIAAYNCEKNSKNKISFYNISMEKSIVNLLMMEKTIKESLAGDYFYLDYQPQFSTEGKKLRGFESLLRIRKPDGSLVSPGDFIPVAEKSDLILKIDEYVLQRAMKEFAQTVKEENPDLLISVNISAGNIADEHFPSKVMKYLSKYDFPAKNLEIEITEYSLVCSMDKTIENITLLKEQGIQVALDDFGTGYTSLSYLSKMPVNLLKIDKSLIDNISTDQKMLGFVTAVISIGHLMNCEVISEGVEKDEQLSLLKQKECDFIQGFVWSKPLSVEEALKLAKS